MMEAQSDDVDIRLEKESLTNDQIAKTRFEKKMTYEVSQSSKSTAFIDQRSLKRN